MAVDAPPENRLLALYRRLVGEPARERDVYVGFALFFGGIALGIVGLVVFLYGSGLDPAEPFFWQTREIALAAAFLGLPAFILSLVVLLPVGRRTLLAAGGGAAVCLAAIGVFIAVYPQSWNVQVGPDYSAQGVALYAAGLAVLVGATGSALVAQYLERARHAASMAGEEAPGTSGHAGSAASNGDDEAVTDEQVRRDIEEAVSAAELSWGGVRKRETKRLTLRTPEVSTDEATAQQFTRSAAKTDRSSSTDDAVAGLQKLRGGERKTAAGSGTDEQLAKLARLRAEQADAPEERDEVAGVIGQMRRRLGL